MAGSGTDLGAVRLQYASDRRTYLLELRSTEKTYMASVSWQYSEDQLIALRQQNASAEAAAPIATGVDLAAINFRYAIEGDNPARRPLRAITLGAVSSLAVAGALGYALQTHNAPRGSANRDCGTEMRRPLHRVFAKEGREGAVPDRGAGEPSTDWSDREPARRAPSFHFDAPLPSGEDLAVSLSARLRFASASRTTGHQPWHRIEGQATTRRWSPSPPRAFG